MRWLCVVWLSMVVFCQTIQAEEPVGAGTSAGNTSVSAQTEQSVSVESGESSYTKRLEEAKNAIRQKKVGSYGMVPVYPRDIEDGTYEIQVESSSPFFKITEAVLLVDGENMSARITIPSLSYRYVYSGTAEAAQQAAVTDLIDCEEMDGCSVFTIPVDALDHEIDCAAFSKKRQRWYDRKLVFDAASLPKEALNIELPDYELIEQAVQSYQVGENRGISTEETKQDEELPQPVKIFRPDGEYSIEVNLTGGSGRASVSSPTLLIVRDGLAYTRLLWSSVYYDYMIVGGETYYNLTKDGGNSTFEIPVTVMDDAMPVIADTTAMGDPVEIEYRLTFYSETIGSKGQIPQEAAKKVLIIAGIMIVVGGILDHLVRKKRK